MKGKIVKPPKETDQEVFLILKGEAFESYHNNFYCGACGDCSSQSFVSPNGLCLDCILNGKGFKNEQSKRNRIFGQH